jgi:hypothetical protein
MHDMSKPFQFTFAIIREYFQAVLKSRYEVITCEEYIPAKARGLAPKTLVNRVDIDLSCKKAKRLAMMFNDLKIKATFFVRLHADEYNPFSFENYRCLKYIRDTGHEIGYHSEIVDASVIWNESAEDCLRRDVATLNTMLGIQVQGVASHGGMTGLNNLDFWRDKKATDFGLLYEAYDKQPAFNLFQESRYVSDSNWTFWKSYENGIVRENDRRTLAEHCKEGPPLIYSLIHPDTYYDEHFYE